MNGKDLGILHRLAVLNLPEMGKVFPQNLLFVPGQFIMQRQHRVPQLPFRHIFHGTGVCVVVQMTGTGPFDAARLDSPVKRGPAFRANEPTGKGIDFPLLRPPMLLPPLGQQVLYLYKGIPVNDWLMGVFLIILLFLTFILDFAERQHFTAIAFAKPGIPHVSFIFEDIQNPLFAPHCLSPQLWHLSALHFFRDALHTDTAQISGVDLTDNGSLGRLDHQRSGAVGPISVWNLRDAERPVLHPHSGALAHILGDGDGFLLRKGAHHAQKHLIGHGAGIEMLFFKYHRYAKLFQFPDRGDAVLRVTGKPGQGFDQNAVDLPVPAILHHALEILSFVGAGAGDALVGVNVHERPVLMAGDQCGVVPHLRGEGMLLILGITADASVSTNPQSGGLLLPDGFNDLHLRHL